MTLPRGYTTKASATETKAATNGKPGRLRVVTLAGRRRVRTETLTTLLKMPRGAVTVFVGWQGIGKGTILSRIAADETRREYGVGIVSDEDSLDATILPRLQAAGADLDHVHTFEPLGRDDVGVLVPKDNAEIARAVELYHMRLLILDPWTNHIDVPDVDKGHVRKALMPFASMCRDTGLTAVLSAHPNRRDTDDPLQSIAHASAVSQVARCVYHVVMDPTQGSAIPKKNPHRLVIHGKANLTGFGHTLRYRLEQTLLVADDNQPEVETVRAEYEGVEETIPDYATARQRLRHIEKIEAPKRPAEYDAAAEWLEQHLAGGRQPRRDVISAAAVHGWSSRTVERAAKVLDVRTVRPPGLNASTPAWWELHCFASSDRAQAGGETGGTGGTHARECSPDPTIHPVSPDSPVSPTAPHVETGRNCDDEELVW